MSDKIVLTAAVVADILEDKKRIDQQVKDLLGSLSDQEIPLDSRWSTFEELAKAGLLGIESYGDGHIDELNDNFTPYDDFYVEKYQTKYYVDMYDHILEKLDPKAYKSWAGKVSEQDVTNWREAVLKAGYRGFVYDW